ncbi:hypothetical protein [Enterococcus faecium]|uniref:hypothetical protein n=1 Tax=Enterococcus faecium TaxID=1352 RepID=UPI001A0F3C0D|nr:hypothetical protein [Enterococcus faecium]EME7159875.1 hypothetical protein [Enterococcus faecium]
MLAKKGNRILNVEESEKEALKVDGYDIVEFDEKAKEYKIIESATGGKTYSVAQYNELKQQNVLLAERNNKLEKENKELKKKTDNLEKNVISDDETMKKEK